MSDGMSFLTGAAFAGVAVLLLFKGGDGLGANNLPTSRSLPATATNPYDPYNPYVTPTPTPIPTAPSSNLYNFEQQRLDGERLRAMLEQQRMETEQLKAQLQNQQLLIESLTAQSDSKALPPRIEAAPPVSPARQQENPLITGAVWALGGMAVTISGGLVVVGVLAVLARQQRPPRTTYVVQQPYNALPHTLQVRRRAEVIPPQMEDRQVNYVEYDR